MVKRIRHRIGKIINSKMRYDTAEKIMYLSPKHRKNIKECLKKYDHAVSNIPETDVQNKIVVVFICQFSALWNGISSIYEEARKNENIIAHLIAIPEKIMGDGYDVSQEVYDYNYAYDFCKRISEDTINGYDSKTKKFYDIKKLHPTYVFLPRPYDIHLPEEYRSVSIKEYAKVCYVPYGYDSTIRDSRYSYEMKFICNVYAIFAENTYYKNMLSNIFELYGNLKNKRIYDLGYPRFDLYKDISHIETKEYQKTVVWLPRWTTNSEVEATTFFVYKELLVKYFIEHSDIKFIFRPHPLMLRNFVSCKLMTEQEKDDFLDLFNKYPNFEHDTDGDYLISFRKADLFISDYSSLLVEEILMNVPVIYTGQLGNFEKVSLEWAKGMYLADSKETLHTLLDMLVSGSDSLKEEREKARNYLLKGDFMSGKRIIEALISDCRE